jgi:hypothetical protein
MWPYRAVFVAMTAISVLRAVPARADTSHEGMSTVEEPKPRENAEKEAPWYDRIQIRGYTQLRYNRIGASNPHLKNDQGDKSIGDPGGFFIRRARLIIYGDMAHFLSIYLQPDFASAFQESLNFGQMRDWYADIFLDQRREFRFRVGQSKVPYGFELMQSSQNRAPLDRTDGLNSAFQNERDLGAYFYYAPEIIRKRFKHLVDSGLKGSGDYGMVGVGIANGQPLNTREKNDNKHFIGRVSVPFEVGSQTLEIGGGGYTGLFVPTRADGISGRKEIRDLRMHATFVLYPQPFGLQAEYNAGVGPELAGKEVVERPLDGGYVMAMVRFTSPSYGNFTPYVRVHRYDGGKKFETSAPRHQIRELNAGLEWQFRKWLELTTEFMESERTVNGKEESGRLLRLQVQLNY